MNTMGTPRRRRLGAVLTAVLLTVGLAACSEEGGEAKGIKLLAAAKLTVCTHLPYEPFQSKNDDGEVVGFDVDLLDLLADDLGVEQDVVNLGEWNQVTSGAAFRAGRCDIAMGGMTITPERQKALTISDPYFEATQALIVKSDAPYQDLSDLEGKDVGVQTDTTGQRYANEHKQEFGYTPVKFEDLSLELNNLKSGRVDAAINDNGVLFDFANSDNSVKVVKEFHTGEQYGFAAKKDDANAKKLIDRFNTVLKKAKQDGTYDKIYTKWFGEQPQAGESNQDGSDGQGGGAGSGGDSD